MISSFSLYISDVYVMEDGRYGYKDVVLPSLRSAPEGSTTLWVGADFGVEHRDS